MLSARLTHSVKLIHIKNYECEAYSHLSYYCGFKWERASLSKGVPILVNASRSLALPKTYSTGCSNYAAGTLGSGFARLGDEWGQAWLSDL